MALHYCPSEASETTVCEPFALGAESPISSRRLEWFSHREEEARKVLRTSTNIKEIQLVLSLFPFENPDIRLALLSHRSRPILDALLTNLQGEDQKLQIHCNNETKLHKTEKILRIIAPNLPNSPVWNTRWGPPIETPLTSTTWITSDIDREMSEAFCRVTFLDLIREAYGYQTDAVAELLGGVNNAQRELRHRIHELCHSKNKYEPAEKAMKNPLAKWAVYNGISDTDAFPDSRDALDSILLPIQDLFMRQDLPLIPMLRRLAVLSTLHQNHILRGEDTKWESLCTADFFFLTQISNNHPSEVAELFTNIDHAHYRELCANDFACTKEKMQSSSERRRQMGSRWSSLADVVKVCVATHSDLVKPTSEVTLDLLNANNYHSGMALLQGLRDAECRPANLSRFWKLLDSENMYANYRATYSKSGGLPFSFPHGWELCRAKDETERGNKLSELFRFLAYPGYTVVTRGRGTRSDSMLTEDDKEGSPASKGLWTLLVTTFCLLGTLLSSARRYWVNLGNQSDKPLAHDIDIEKGIKPVGCLDFLEGPFDQDRVRVGSTGKRKMRAASRPVLVRRAPQMRRRFWCENCQLQTGRSQGRCVLCSGVSHNEVRNTRRLLNENLRWK